MITIDCPVSPFHRVPLADVYLTYGAVIKLCQLDAVDRNYDILSGTHEEAVDVSALFTGRMPSEGLEAFDSMTCFDIRRN